MTTVQPTENSFTPGLLWPDSSGLHINAHGGGLLYQHGMYYWYGEHKVEGSTGNTAQVGIRVYSSSDLYHWSNEGIALAVSDDPTSPITAGCIMERPKVIFCSLTGKFVMWFHLELKDNGYHAALCATAVSDSPLGPFRFVDAFRLNAGIWPLNVTEADRMPQEQNYLERDWVGGQMSRDMTLFVDDDGAAYHITSSEENATTHISRLTDDYLASSGQWVRVFPGRYMEAHAMCKRQGKYYYLASGCTGWAPNQARSAVADSVFGPWTELGDPCVGTNPHTGLDQQKTFGGQSTYIQPIVGRGDTYIAMFDEWHPDNAIDGRYYWLPLTFDGDRMTIRWHTAWSL